MKKDKVVKTVSMNSLKEFQHIIEEIKRLDEVTYMEAITDYCENEGIDVEDVVKLISPALRDKITQEASALRIIKPEHRSTVGDLFE